jgi:hypothetical protein
MQYRELKNKAKKLGLRVTKNVDGKRVKLTARELRSKITTNFENSVRNAQKVIRICQTVVAPAATPRPQGTRVPVPPPPPPPPKKPVLNNKRAKLMAELKATLAKKGLR